MAYDLVANLRLNTGNFVQGMRDAARQMSSMSNNAENVESQVSGLSSSLKTLGGAVAGYFAVDSIKNLGVSMVEAAAATQALGAQFDQVFGADAGEARGVVENLGKDFGMLPNRIKPAFTQMTSMFKGLGLETGEAMDEATKAVTLTADAAAFYDKSYEDANASLNSFIKGNYEGGESIGLFASETQLAGWAAKNLKLDWQKLGEADKQMARLKFAESMQKAAGATGQAKRESDSYENQLGNLKQTWTDLKAKLAMPILEPVIKGLKSFSKTLSNVNTDSVISKVSSFGSYMSSTFGPLVSDAKIAIEGMGKAFVAVGGVDALKIALEGVKSGLAWVKDNSDLVVAGVVGIVGALATFKILTGINSAVGFFNKLMVAYRSGTLLATLATYGLNTALLTNPFTWVAVAIGAVIAAGVLLYRNWDTVKVKGKQLWESLKGVWTGIEDGFSKAWDVIKGAAETSINFIIKGINGMIKLINKIPGVEVPLVPKVDWTQSNMNPAKSPVKSAQLKPVDGTPLRQLPKAYGISGSNYHGLDYVPKDGYVARLHKGERVLTAEENRGYSGGGGDVNVNFAGAQFVVREEADIDKIVAKMLEKIKEARERGGGAVWA